ncbi:MAG: hypothetical protein U0U70_15205 [Chitinophagaceae bacterium]
MKRASFLFAVLFVSSITICQTKPADKTEKSKLETFTLKTGSLIKKEFLPVGSAGKVEVSVLKLSDLVANTTISGIRFETSVQRSYGSSSKYCFLDSDEIDGLIKSGNLLLSSLNQPAETYTEYQFTSRDGFQAGAFLSKKQWSYFLKLDKYDSDSNVWLEREDFQKLIDLLGQAKAKL